MNSIEDLIRRAVGTSNIPDEDIRKFAEENNMLDLYLELTGQLVEETEGD